MDDYNHRIQVYDSNRVYVTTMGETDVQGSDNAHFRYPVDIAMDGAGNIYVVENGSHRVQVFDSNRNYVRTIGVSGVSGNDFDHLRNPTALAVSAAGWTFVASGWGDRVHVFDNSGVYLTTMGGSSGTNTGQMRQIEGLAVDNAGNVYAVDALNHRIQKFALGVPGWKQANINGFGDPQNLVLALGVFNNQMYAGTGSATGGQVWRTATENIWTRVFTFGLDNNTGADSFAVFSNTLYLGTLDSAGAQIYRTADGVIWTSVVTAGFGITNNTEIINMTVYSGYLYAATLNFATGGQIWRSTDGISWTNVISDNFGSGSTSWWTFEAFNGQLYAGLAGSTEGLLYRTDGITWTAVTTDGFNDSGNGAISSLAAFKGYIYAGTRNMNNGAQVWHSSTGDPGSWTQVAAGGFGDPNNQRGYRLIVAGDYLYFVITNLVSGDQVWRTPDGVTWEHIGFDGWGDSNNIYSDYSDKGAVVFNNSLFIGTQNSANGGEVWQMLKLVYLPLVLRN